MIPQASRRGDPGTVKHPVWTLLGKELLQVRRHRSAIASLTLLPIMVMVIVPMGQLFSIQAMGRPARAVSSIPSNLGIFQGLAWLDDPSRMFSILVLPLMMVVSGLATPAVLAIHTIVVERERRTLELLIALPITISDVIGAKLVAVLVLSCCVVLPLFAIDAAFGLITRILKPIDVLLLLVLLLAAVACSGCFALVLALVARDFRTANNINGAMVGPLVLVSILILGLIPGEARLIALSLVLAMIGALCILVAVRWLTFERYVG